MLMSILQQILQWDRELFNKVNSDWSNSFFDAILPYIRNAMVWAPLYLFFIVFTIINFKRSGSFWVLFGVLAVATSDIISSWAIKELVFRVRPCHDEALAGHIHILVNYCPMSSSFTSSHAANHFTLATFIFFTFRNHLNKWLWLVFLWAFIVAYAQVYVGVHYPGDIICGAFIGYFIGYTWAKTFTSGFLLTADQEK